MISKLPRWAWVGGALLAGIAGMVNAVGFLSYTHQAVTHLTGTTTLLALAVVQPAEGEWPHLLAMIGAFVGGAMFSGFVIEHGTLQLGRRYGVALAVEAALLAGAAALMGARVPLGSCLASAACGLQNAMAGSYSGTVLRTAHLTGMFTDLGMALGHWLRGAETDWRRLRLCAHLIAAFAFGGVLGALCYPVLGTRTLYLPAALTGLVALGYAACVHLARPRATP